MIVLHVRTGQAAGHLDEHARSVWFGKLDARAKILGIFAFVIAAALLTDPVLVMCALACALVTALLSRLPPRHLAKAYLAALPFLAFASFSVFLFAGFERGISMLARTSACVIALLVLATGTDTFELFSGLRRLRVPGILTTLLMLTHRYLLLLSEELDRMRTARRARGFSGGRSLLDVQAFRVLSNTAGMLLVRSSGRADRIFEALKMRGFSKDMRPWRETRIAALDAAFMLALVAIAASLLLLQMEVFP
ncbi:MAG: energy-coupling factor transporter transmembrane protein EcfT [Thermoplasmata archaeon]|jgi:cobalt/nickel transport system permease protein|nr:energy-coupling factor transporter transmembrane protein EcfT [Thermoplasmata archaeon]